MYAVMEVVKKGMLVKKKCKWLKWLKWLKWVESCIDGVSFRFVSLVKFSFVQRFASWYQI